MRIAIVLALTILGGVIGFYAGYYAYQLTHPRQTASSKPVARSQNETLQNAYRRAGSSLERVRNRQNWLIGGALIGGGIGLAGTVIAFRAKQPEKRR